MRTNFKIGDRIKHRDSGRQMVVKIRDCAHDYYGMEPQGDCFWMLNADAVLVEAVEEKKVRTNFKIGDRIRHQSSDVEFVVEYIKDHHYYGYMNNIVHRIFNRYAVLVEAAKEEKVRTNFKIGDRIRSSVSENEFVIEEIQEDFYTGYPNGTFQNIFRENAILVEAAKEPTDGAPRIHDLCRSAIVSIEQEPVECPHPEWLGVWLSSRKRSIRAVNWDSIKKEWIVELHGELTEKRQTVHFGTVWGGPESIGWTRPQNGPILKRPAKHGVPRTPWDPYGDE